LRAFSEEVDKMEKYQIQFNGLKPGTHSFDFRPDQSFFEQYHYNDFTFCSIRVHVEMEKEDHMLVFLFDILGKVGLPCDRCSEPMTIELKGRQNLFVKLSDHNEEESEDILIIKESEGKFDVSQFIYEYVSLMIPLYHVHGNDSKGNSLCDPEVLKKLLELKESHNPDPRWEVLKKLREKK